MPDLAPGDFHIDSLLTNYLQAFRPNGYISDQIFPVIPVVKQTNAFPKIDKGNWFRIPNTNRAPGTAPREVRYTVSSDNYRAVNYALATVVDFESIDNADAPHNPEMQSVEFLKTALWNDLEARVQSTVAIGVGSAQTLTGGNAWTDYLNSDPLTNLETARNAIRSSTGLTPNVCVVPDKTWLVLRRHPDVVRAIFPGAGVGGVASPQQFADLIQVDKVLIPNAIKDTSPENANSTYSDVWSTNVELMYVNPNPGLMTATFGVMFHWTGPNIGNSMPGNWAVQRSTDMKRGVIELRTGYYMDEKITAAELGFEIRTGV